MSTLILSRRARSSTSNSNPPIDTKARQILGGLLERLGQELGATEKDGYPKTRALLESLHLVTQHVSAVTPPSALQDDFRNVEGFGILVGVLRAFSGYYNPLKRTTEEKDGLFELLGATLRCLSSSLRDHPGNKRFFRYRVEAGGWEALEQAIASIGLGGSDADLWSSCRLFGKLFEFALDDPGFDRLFRAIAAEQKNSASSPPDQAPTPGEADTPNHPPRSHHESSMALDIKKVITTKSIFRNPGILRAVITFWESLPRSRRSAPNPCSMLVLQTLATSIPVSLFNLSAVHSTAILSHLLRATFEPRSDLTDVERQLLRRICKMLMYLGVNRTADALFLLSTPTPEASEFCREMTAQYSGPPFFHFDLSLHGHSAVELPSLGRPFPPQSTAGYTFTAWIRVDQFDPSAHTTIFGIRDKTQTCFLLAYLERDTHNFILQTSVTAQRPSVRFKTVAFQEKHWYHIALVHRRPRTISTSKASLYVNGEFVEQSRCSYPASPPFSNASTESFASFASSSTTNKPNPVEAFIGTPKDLSTLVGPGLVFSKWTLASAHLFEDALSDDLLAVHHRLGPRYQGNFQDSLGGFQTYAASAALGLRNEMLHPGKDDSSDIIKAIREKASALMPEGRILLGFLPTGILYDECLSRDSLVSRALPRAAHNSLVHRMKRHGSTIAINTAVPSLTDALLVQHGVGILTGKPVVAAPSHLDENFWRLAGFTPVALKLLQRATTCEETLRAVEMILKSVQSSWRNSEAMERDGGYNVLGMLLRIKLGYGGAGGPDNGAARLFISNEERDKLSFQLLSLVLGFVGYKHGEPVESFIINPLAYRILLIDFDIWRKSAHRTQTLYYNQFVTFAVRSKYHEFNSRRLMRMRIIKRLLDAMKAETVTVEVLPAFMDAFEHLIKCNFSTEVHRALALFLTYIFHSPAASLPRTPKPSSAISRSSTPGLGIIRKPTIVDPNVMDNTNSPTLLNLVSKQHLGKHILSMFARLLCEKGSFVNIKKFARTVTNKWLLYLLSHKDAEIVAHGCKILARLLVSHGQGYTSKFSGKTGGFVIMADSLKRWWDITTLWPICFSILFGYDVAEIDFGGNFSFFNLLDIFKGCKIVYPDILPVMAAMLQRGIKDVVRQSEHPDSPRVDSEPPSGPRTRPSAKERRSRARSMDLREALEDISMPQSDSERQASRVVVLQTVTRFFADLHGSSPDFKDFALSSEFVRYLLSGLYPAIVSTDPVLPEVELHAQVLNFEGNEVIIRPAAGSSAPAPIVRASSGINVRHQPPASSKKGTPLRKASSFILLASEPTKSPTGPSQARLTPILSPKKTFSTHQTRNAAVESILELVINVFLDQVLQRRDFFSFGLFLKVPPGFQEHQAYFESYILRNTISHLSSAVQLDARMVCEPKVLTNLARFNVHITEAIFEGWFMGGEDSIMEFTGMLLEYLQRDDVSSLKSVRLCSQAVTTIRRCFLKIILLRLSAIDDPDTSDEAAHEFMQKILIWQPALLGCLTGDDEHFRLMWYQLYAKLIDDRHEIRLSAATILRIMMVQKPDEASTLFRQFMTLEQQQTTKEFEKLTEVDNEAFVKWVDLHRASLDVLFFGGMSRVWEDWVATENQKSADSARTRTAKRKERLKAWMDEIVRNDNLILRHQMANGSWMKSIYNTEHIKHQRLMQDQQDDLAYTASTFAKMERDLIRPGAIFGETHASTKWKLDPTEGRNRMRLRLLPDYSNNHLRYQPKRRTTDQMSSTVLRVNTAMAPLQQPIPKMPMLLSQSADELAPSATDTPPIATEPESTTTGETESGFAPEDDFELIEDPNEPQDGDDGFEDRNRKVMRRLQQGDKVQAVYNICRIVGLIAIEGILIIGKDALYIMDNVFQCAAGEIVNAWQAPADERDPFSQIIMGNKSLETKPNSGRTEQESRSWRWSEVISISKRRYLFRDVSMEIFFTDGRSYLLTTHNPSVRDDLFVRLFNKAPHMSNPNALPNPGDAWRLESLKVVDEGPQGFGSKLGSLFNSQPLNPIMKKWQKGEISNFHYLMVVNTMAGRTFNDLTQYPVFPWVLADYESEELNLNDPATFRDLSRPMGGQSAGRVPSFLDNYKTLLEMQDTPYHYGTHYSSSMIVASYLIRLPPFVDSYIALQGGNFDHADRLFHSIPGAWKSASAANKTDVRELTPEFFCLPEFLTNINSYSFGAKESTGEQVDNVVLPPWAKGDPKLFIAKHREALECPYVSQHLHKWIDLVFGFKQTGDEAVEAMNVFHHLTYRGAKDLDNIIDPQDRTIIVETIHNFGQTPHQVFAKSHPARENIRSPARRLDTSVNNMNRVPYPLFECHERVSALIYAPKLDRLLVAAPFRLNFAPYDKYLEWGYADRSVRFFYTENRRPAGLYENLHGGQISCALFADSKTLITAGEDCVMAVFDLYTTPGRSVELSLRSALHGHKNPVTVLAASKSFSTLLSVSESQTCVWDLNRLELVRRLPFYRPVECARINDVTGDIMLCSGPNVVFFTINGSMLLDQRVCDEADDYVHSCAFYEGTGSEWVQEYLVFTGHKRGRVNIWRRITTKTGRWQLELLRRLDNEEGNEAGISCVVPMPTCLYTGDEDGRVYEWNSLPQRER